MAVGWLNYVKLASALVGVAVVDRDKYLELPDLNGAVRLSRRTRRPVFRFRDSDYLVDILCYYSPRAERYVCRALPRVMGIEKYEWQAVYRMIFEACYKPYTERLTYNIHLECHKTYLFTSREINKYIKRYCKRGLRSLKCVLEYFNEIYLQAKACCEVDCVTEHFLNYTYLIENAETEYDYYSSNRYSDTCYYDRCIDRLPEPMRERYRRIYSESLPFICEIDVEKK